ncbi:alpha/beta fold hydrolase [Streptomyces sp. NPDC002144]
MKRRPLLHHRVLGPIDAPLLVLGPSLGTSTTVWDPHVAVLAESHRVLCYDLPGHGGSPSDLVQDHKPGRTTVGDLAHMVLDLVAHHGRDRFHYAGISLGGGVGVHLALHQPDHIASLALVCSWRTSARRSSGRSAPLSYDAREPAPCSRPCSAAGSPIPAQPRPPSVRRSCRTSRPPTRSATPPAATPSPPTTFGAT